MKNVVTFLKWLFMPFKVFQLLWYFLFHSYWKELTTYGRSSAEELKKDKRPLLTEFTVAGRVYELHRHPWNKNYGMLKDQKTGRIVIQGYIKVYHDEKKDILYIRKNYGVWRDYVTVIYRIADASHLSWIDRYWLLFPEKREVTYYPYLAFQGMFEMDGRWFASIATKAVGSDKWFCFLEDIEVADPLTKVVVRVFRDGRYRFRPFKNSQNSLIGSLIELATSDDETYEQYPQRNLLYSLTHGRIILDAGLHGLKEISFWYTENNQLYLLGQQPYGEKSKAKTMIFALGEDHVAHPILETFRAFEVLHEYPDVSPLMRIFLIRYIQYGQFSLKGANSKTLLNVPRQDLSQGASPIAALIEHKTAHRIKHIAATEFFFESKKISKTTARVRVL